MGKVRSSTCENFTLVIGQISTVIMIKVATRTLLGLAMTKRATADHRPSAFGVIPLFRITYLSTLCPRIFNNAGKGISAPTIAEITTVIAAYPKVLRKY